jgi:hypothetical protein
MQTGCVSVGTIGTVRKILRFGQLRRYAFTRPTARKAELAMAIPTRDPVVRYLLLLHATIFRQSGVRAAAERLDEHARAIELLANYVRGLAEDDERLLQLGTLAVRGGEFLPGPATEHALSQFKGASVDECATFLSRLNHIARDDALARAREFGFLPPRPR